VLYAMEDTQSGHGIEIVQQQQRQDSDLATLIDLPESSNEVQQVLVQGNKGYYVVDDILILRHLREIYRFHV